MADTMEMYEKGKLYQVDLAQLKADPNQPRKFMDPQALDDLTESIKQHNVLMPILFCRGDMMPRGHVPEARRDRNVSPECWIKRGLSFTHPRTARQPGTSRPWNGGPRCVRISRAGKSRW